MEKVRVAFMFVAMVAMLLLALDGVHGDGVCNVSPDGLKACKPAIQIKNPKDKPAAACCAALKNADYNCLCGYKDSYLLKAMEIDVNRALALPQMCGFATQPYQCPEAAQKTRVGG